MHVLVQLLKRYNAFLYDSVFAKAFVYNSYCNRFLFIYILVDISVIMEVQVTAQKTDDCMLYYNYTLFSTLVLLKVIYQQK